MDWAIVMGLLAIVLIICVCILYHAAKKAKESADEVIRRASELITDIGIMESDLIELRQQLMELSNTLYEISEDGDVDAGEYEDLNEDEVNPESAE